MRRTLTLITGRPHLETLDVATDVECHIVPNEDIIDTSGRVPTRHLTFKAHLAKYNADIHEGDIVVRNPDTDDEEEMHVYRVRPYGNVLMQLILRDRGGCFSEIPISCQIIDNSSNSVLLFL